MYLGACVLLALAASVASRGLSVVFEWKQLGFAFPLTPTRQDYIPENNVPVGLEVWRDKLFITVPRWKPGVPVSLAYVSLKEAGRNKSPLLTPYPDWASHNLSLDINPRFRAFDEAPVRIVSPFRVRADSCDRLWVLDTGKSDILGDVEQVGPNQLLVFDLKTDSLIRQFEIPRSFLRNESFFANIAVDVKGSDCGQTHAYLADLGGYCLVVYSWQKNRAWRVTHPYFQSDPMAGDYNVSGLNFQWTDGLFGLALSAEDKGFRKLYFHPFSSNSEFAVSTQVLQNETLWSRAQAPGPAYHQFEYLGSRSKHSQSCASFLDEKSGVLFYSQVTKNSVGCWNTRHPYIPSTQGQVAVDSVTMVFPNDLKVDRNRTLWVLTDRMPLFLYSHLNYSDVNFRVLSAPVDKAIAQTICSEKTYRSGACREQLELAVLLLLACLVQTAHRFSS